MKCNLCGGNLRRGNRGDTGAPFHYCVEGLCALYNRVIYTLGNGQPVSRCYPCGRPDERCDPARPCLMHEERAS